MYYANSIQLSAFTTVSIFYYHGDLYFLLTKTLHNTPYHFIFTFMEYEYLLGHRARILEYSADGRELELDPPRYQPNLAIATSCHHFTRVRVCLDSGKLEVRTLLRRCVSRIGITATTNNRFVLFPSELRALFDCTTPFFHHLMMALDCRLTINLVCVGVALLLCEDGPSPENPRAFSHRQLNELISRQYSINRVETLQRLRVRNLQVYSSLPPGKQRALSSSMSLEDAIAYIFPGQMEYIRHLLTFTEMTFFSCSSPTCITPHCRDRCVMPPY